MTVSETSFSAHLHGLESERQRAQIGVRVQPLAHGAAEPELLVSVTFDCAQTTYTVEKLLGIWSISVWELLELAICLEAISERDQTTENLPDAFGESGWVVQAQWTIVQGFMHTCTFEMTAKKTDWSAGYRLISILLPVANTPDDFKCYSLLSSPDEINAFAKSLREIHHAVEAIQESLPVIEDGETDDSSKRPGDE